MRLTCVAFIASVLLGAARLAAAPCTPVDTALCLTASRFRVEVSWKDFQGRTGAGHAVALTPDTGYFWFFNAANVELVVKVLDARAVNGKFWVFFGALSNVEYTLTVTDTATGSTKSYLNPANRFASVADTSAFAGGPAAATHETTLADGTDVAPSSQELIQSFVESAPAAAFTPCPDTRFGMLLNGCRFHIEVAWDAGGGRTGRGHWVQLTNDTGYFWFFNAANVELIVKVLDARAVNGRFWVFFGALSNVGYTITVTDSVTKSVKRYVNRAGKLASVGDTAAFRGGYSVAAVRDVERAVTADLGAAGGSVTATGVDGTVFTLELPAQALLSPETVTLTPVSRIDRFPFSGGLAAGVEIEPDGLELKVPATLTIQPTSPPPVNRTLPYSYRRGGEDFILYPRKPDTSSLRLPLGEFGGYGVGLGELGEAASQVKRAPAALLAPYLQRYAYEVLLRVRGQITQQELVVRLLRIFRESWDEVVAPGLNGPVESPLAPLSDSEEVNVPVPPLPGTCRELLENLDTMLGIIRQKQLMGVEDDSGRVESGIDDAREAYKKCLQESFDRCVGQNNPFEIQRMLFFAHDLALAGEDDPLLTTFIEGGLMERCLRFELDFESEVVAETSVGGKSFVHRLAYRAQHVPLRFNFAGNDSFHSIWEGGCTLLPVAAAYTFPETGCTVTIQPNKGWFTSFAAWIRVLDDPTKGLVKVLYNPGELSTKNTLKCGKDTQDFPLPRFHEYYVLLHHDEFIESGFFGFPLYVAKDWDQLRFDSPQWSGPFFAIKRYVSERDLGGGSKLTEQTYFVLKHTPDVPMPACP